MAGEDGRPRWLFSDESNRYRLCGHEGTLWRCFFHRFGLKCYILMKSWEWYSVANVSHQRHRCRVWATSLTCNFVYLDEQHPTTFYITSNLSITLIKNRNLFINSLQITKITAGDFRASSQDLRWWWSIAKTCRRTCERVKPSKRVFKRNSINRYKDNKVGSNEKGFSTCEPNPRLMSACDNVN